jgi:hypothetical protein
MVRSQATLTVLRRCTAALHKGRIGSEGRQDLVLEQLKARPRPFDQHAAAKREERV